MIYRKYILRSLIKFSIVLGFALNFIIWITQTLSFLKLINQGVDLEDWVFIVTLILPFLLFSVMPIIALISSIYTYSNIQSQRELIILKSSGLSNFQIAIPAIVFGMMMSALSYALSLYFVPISYMKLKNTLIDVQKSQLDKVIGEQNFHQISKFFTVYINKKIDNKFYDIVLFDKQNPNADVIICAKYGYILNNPTNQRKNNQINNELIKEKYVRQNEHIQHNLSDNRQDNDITHWPNIVLIEGIRYEISKDGKVTQLHFKRLEALIPQNESYLHPRKKSNLELFVSELIWPDEKIYNKNEMRELYIHAHHRIIWPLYSFLMVFFAISIFLKYEYSRKDFKMPYVYAIAPLVIISYIHFFLQKLSYTEPNYIALCYINALIGIIISAINISKS